MQVCTAETGETIRNQSLVEHPSSAEPTIADDERKEPHTLSQQEVHHQQHMEPTSSEPTQGVTPKEKFKPKSGGQKPTTR